MEEEEKQLMEEGERKEQEMMTKVWLSLIKPIALLAYLAMVIHSRLLFFWLNDFFNKKLLHKTSSYIPLLCIIKIISWQPVLVFYLFIYFYSHQ